MTKHEFENVYDSVRRQILFRVNADRTIIEIKQRGGEVYEVDLRDKTLTARVVPLHRRRIRRQKLTTVLE